MASKPTSDEIHKLRRTVDWAIRQGLGSEDVVPLLLRLARSAPRDSDDFSFAHKHLAELSVETHPWRAALSAREVIAGQADDDAAWALLGLSYTLLGHYRAAVSAYRRALALAPANPWYAHNLGHLLDVGLNRPADALALLSGALRKKPKEKDIAASYAHALGRAGRPQDGCRLLRRYVENGASPEHRALLRWLEREAPDEKLVESTALRRHAKTGPSGAVPRSSRSSRSPKRSG